MPSFCNFLTRCKLSSGGNINRRSPLSKFHDVFINDPKSILCMSQTSLPGFGNNDLRLEKQDPSISLPSRPLANYPCNHVETTLACNTRHLQ